MKTQEFHITVTIDADGQGARVEIGANPMPPLPAAVMVAAEHFANMMALQGDDYEKSLELLCEGARKAKVLLSQGKLIQ